METELKKLEKFDAAYFRGKNYFDGDGTQNYLVFQPMYKYFKTFTENNFIYTSSWESKGLSNKRISSTKTSNYDQPPIPVYDNARIRLSFTGDLLKQNKVTYDHGSIMNIYIVYRLTPYVNTLGVTLENCLFVAVKSTKNADIDKYKYSGYGIGFDSRGSFSRSSGRYGENVIIFGADMSSSAHANDKTRNTLALGKDFIQGIENTAIYAEKIYSTNLTAANKKICLSLHYNGDSSYLFVNSKEVINFKAKNSEIAPYPLCLGGLSKDFSPSKTHKTGLVGYVYDVSVDSWAIANDKILDIHKYFMKNNKII